MAKAVFVQRGDNIDFTAAEDIEYMDVVPLADRIGIALETIEQGKKGTVTITGTFDLPADTGAIEVGQDVFWDTSKGKITAAEGANTIPAGCAIEGKAQAEIVARVRIG